MAEVEIKGLFFEETFFQNEFQMFHQRPWNYYWLFYTTTITIEEDNVQQLLPAACLLQMTQVQQYCCEFLSKQLHPSNCLGC